MSGGPGAAWIDLAQDMGKF